MTNTKINVVNDHVLLVPDSVTVVHGKEDDYLLYKDWEINISDADHPKPFYIIYDNDWDDFATIEDAMKFIDEQIRGELY